MRLPLAVQLDIRPRLRIPEEPRARRAAPWRLPPLAVPAVGYWVAMGALTYFFAHLGPHPLDAAFPEGARQELREPIRQPVRVAPPASTPAVPDFLPPAPADDDRSAASPNSAQAVPSNSVIDESPRSADARPPKTQHDSAELKQPRAPMEEPSPHPALALPEFTDSSRPEARARAADGPRIDSLFEPASSATSHQTQEAPPLEGAAPARVMSCEAAIARNTEEIAIGGPAAAPDVTREAYASILQNGRYLSGCRIPDRTVFEICAAVKDGRAVGITVVSNPADPSLNACVRGAVARLKFPNNPKLDVTHTRFDAAPH